ncbi:MAG: cytochrome c [Bdellovibrionota bacterium]|nr:cytochrome c [Bdellovibrionota bacterium]
MKFLMLALLVLSFNTLAFEADKHFQKVCATCHTIGGGDKIGPDLAGLDKRRKAEWVHKFVNYPDGMINGDPEEPGYEKADPMAKKVYDLYKPQMMADQEMTLDQVKAMLKWIGGQKKQPKGKITKLK